MGIYYDIYAMKSKHYMHLGKKYNHGFQMPAQRLAQFLVDHIREPIEIIGDHENQPDEDETAGWVQVGNWACECGHAFDPTIPADANCNSCGPN